MQYNPEDNPKKIYIWKWLERYECIFAFIYAY